MTRQSGGREGRVIPGSIEAYLEAHERYQGYREAAYHLTWEQMRHRLPSFDLRLSAINRDAISYWAALKEEGHIHPAGGFDWLTLYAHFRSLPRRFDIAIWDGSLLSGLAIGKASRGPENVTICWLERFTLTRVPLKGLIAEVAVTAADHFANLLGKQYLMIRSPADGAMPIYESLGFSLAGRRFGVPYCSRAVA